MPKLEMNYCMQCGTRLEMRMHPQEETEVAYCPSCEAFRHPVYNTAVSMVVQNASRDRILLIQQYGRPSYILVAGYVNRGEDAEDAAVREVREEMGLKVTAVRFNHSHFFAPSNTLMLNFTAEVESEEVHVNTEVDSYAWFSKDEARQQILQGSLAQAFLEGALTGVYHWPVKKETAGTT